MGRGRKVLGKELEAQVGRSGDGDLRMGERLPDRNVTNGGKVEVVSMVFG